MAKTRWQAASYALILAIVAPIGVFGPRFILSTHTADCPLSHKLSPDWHCAGLDAEGGRTLVLHRYLEGPGSYLEIADAAGTRAFRLPPRQRRTGAPQSPALVAGERDTIVWNGRLERLEPVP